MAAIFLHARDLVESLACGKDELTKGTHSQVNGGDARIQKHDEIGGRETQIDGAIVAYAIRDQPVGGAATPVVEEAPDAIGGVAKQVCLVVGNATVGGLRRP